jgi:glutamate--cysteine ligase
MGRLGYQSDAQANLGVSFNSLEAYAAPLQRAMTTPYPPYEAVGVHSPGGEYTQLATSLLQIENEFYGTIRPKRSIRRGERPLHALRERGIEYVEVRCMDLDPFEPLGITAATMRFLDMFLLHCLLSPSPADSPAESAALARNQQRVAAEGRRPGLTVEQPDGSGEIRLADWGCRILDECAPLAEALDAARGGHGYAEALERARATFDDMALTPSARVLAAMRADFGGSFVAFGRAQSAQAAAEIMRWPWSDDDEAAFGQAARQSIAEQAAREAADTMPFEAYRRHYLATESLWPAGTPR